MIVSCRHPIAKVIVMARDEARRPRPRRLPGHRRRCPECHGSGHVPGIVKTTGMGKGMGSSPGTCPTCDGIGWLPTQEDEGTTDEA
jgi:hypothetical protein